MSLEGGVLVTKTGQGLQFANAISVAVQGKDKALKLGAVAKAPAASAKLPSVSLNTTLLKDAASKAVAAYDDGDVQFLLPQGLPKNATGDLATLWQGAKLTYKKASNDKAPTEVPIPEFVAFFPGGTEELRKTCTDTKALQVLGGADKAFATHLEWVAAAFRAFPSDPAITPLEKYVEQAMRQRFERFENGLAGLDVLDQALKYTELSQSLFANQPEQDKLRKAIIARKAWLDRRIATLRAFAASEQWDPLLVGAREMEVYEQAFPELGKRHTEALQQSLQRHRKLAQERLAEGEYGAAYRELRLACLRRPSDASLQEEARVAWTEYSRRVAIDRQSRRRSLSAGVRDAVERDLYFAEQNRQSKSLDEAFKNVQHAESLLTKALPAEAVCPESLKVLYKKAEVLAAQGRLSEALTTLDSYDLLAVDEERQAATQLRNQLSFQIDRTLKDAKAQVRKAWSESRFLAARNLSLQALKVKEDDAELLLAAGSAAFIARDREASRALLSRYLEVSNTLDGNAEQRSLVRRLLPAVNTPAPAAEEGEPNWMSGRRLPRGVYYCPSSLAFQPHIDRIEVSGKMDLSFQWDGARLQSITPTWEKNQAAGVEKKISFAYDSRVAQVAAVAAETEPAAPSGDADEIVRRMSLVLPNNGYIDPLAVERVTGKNITLGFAGNRFFNPYVWEKLCYFRLVFDDQGRVQRAVELSEPGGAPTSYVAEFEWNGLQLTAIRGYEGPEEQRRTKIYERTLQYADTRLISETVMLQGRSSRINYSYKGDKLVSANCDKNAHPDGRSRQALFAGN